MSEYTITVTVREEGDGVHVVQRSSLAGTGNLSLAACTAGSLSQAVKHEVERVLKAVELAEGCRVTIHTLQ